MTTEVLRNMLYAGSDGLRGLAYVVMDEVHYLADRFRGAVWEEVIIHLPQEVLLVSLSATVSNAEEFGEWLQTVRGATRVVVEEHRPVPLWQHVLAGRRLYDLFVERRPNDSTDDDVGGNGREPVLNRELVQLAQEESRVERRGGRNRPRTAGRRAASAPHLGAEPRPGHRAARPRRACSRPSPSSSAVPAATPPSPSA